VLAKDLLLHYRALSEQSFTVVDLETTGQAPPEDRAIEISIVQASLKDGVQHQQTHLINPGVPISPYIQRFTGISAAMIEAAPPAEERLIRILCKRSKIPRTKETVSCQEPRKKPTAQMSC
jgi:DNA polymerase III subunit epsilon